MKSLRAVTIQAQSNLAVLSSRGTFINVSEEEAPPRVQTLTLQYTNLHRNGTRSVYLEQTCTSYITGFSR